MECTCSFILSFFFISLCWLCGKQVSIYARYCVELDVYIHTQTTKYSEIEIKTAQTQSHFFLFRILWAYFHSFKNSRRNAKNNNNNYARNDLMSVSSFKVFFLQSFEADVYYHHIFVFVLCVGFNCWMIPMGIQVSIATMAILDFPKLQ